MIEMVDPEPKPDDMPAEMPAPVPDEAAARELVRKFYVGEMKALKNGDIEAYVSTEAVDRVGDVIRSKGWQIDNYKKTGAPVLFSHDYSQPPIGKAIEIEVQRKGLWSVTRFHEKTQMSRDLAKLAREGDMKSWSVGFNPIDSEQRKDDKGNFLGYIFNKAELLEYSLVAVPANPEAVSKAIHLAQRGIISHQIAAIFAGPSPSAEQDDAAKVFGAKAEAVRAAREETQSKIIGNHFLKGILNARRG